jgi:hypothetical protein
VVGVPFFIRNPYQFKTKTELTTALREIPKPAYQTISCDGRYRQAGLPSQCGYCSSCLLRRMALLNTFGRDDTDYVVTHRSTNGPLIRRSHFKAMDLQAAKLEDILSLADPWRGLQSRYPELHVLSSRIAKAEEMPESNFQARLLELYRSHVGEWKQTRELLQILAPTFN